MRPGNARYLPMRLSPELFLPVRLEKKVNRPLNARAVFDHKQFFLFNEKLKDLHFFCWLHTSWQSDVDLAFVLCALCFSAKKGILEYDAGAPSRLASFSADNTSESSAKSRSLLAKQLVMISTTSACVARIRATEEAPASRSIPM